MTMSGDWERALTAGRRSYYGGREWRVTPSGVISTDGRGRDTVHRTAGDPLTMRRYLAAWRDPLVRASAEEAVPLPVLLAVVAAENGPARMVDGAPRILPPRTEPGYVSDDATPHRVSVGPCHLLLSTARDTLRRPDLTRAELADLGLNLTCAARYIRFLDRRWNHGMDPVLVGAAYNAGGLYDASDPSSRFHNPWHLRSWGTHLDRIAAWYGDALAVLGAAREPETEPDPADLDPPQLPHLPLPFPRSLWQRVRSLVGWG